VFGRHFCYFKVLCLAWTQHFDSIGYDAKARRTQRGWVDMTGIVNYNNYATYLLVEEKKQYSCVNIYIVLIYAYLHTYKKKIQQKNLLLYNKQIYTQLWHNNNDARTAARRAI